MGGCLLPGGNDIGCIWYFDTMKTNQHGEIFIQYRNLFLYVLLSDFMEYSAVVYSQILPVDNQEECQEPVLLWGILTLEVD